MVALSGAHSIGQARCSSFRDRIYSNTSNIDPAFALARQATCPRIGGDANLAPLDPQSPGRFGNNFFQALMNRRGLLNSDQVLFNGGSSDSIVRTYANAATVFSTDFMNAMFKMGNLSPLTELKPFSVQSNMRIPQSFFGGTLQWNIKEAFTLGECHVLQVQREKI
ncbi:Peroxidase [Thalictrum thalictroides]|uniref:peroxidase n=1 Tax=Thalictrum thalictroides TaxID=46969 RepID=A0A7J6WZE6_THATH|nr:Peroxidase [Thalictrum thalictroides]